MTAAGVFAAVFVALCAIAPAFAVKYPWEYSLCEWKEGFLQVSRVDFFVCLDSSAQKVYTTGKCGNLLPPPQSEYSVGESAAAYYEAFRTADIGNGIVSAGEETTNGKGHRCQLMRGLGLLDTVKESLGF